MNEKEYEELANDLDKIMRMLNRTVSVVEKQIKS